MNIFNVISTEKWYVAIQNEYKEEKYIVIHSLKIGMNDIGNRVSIFISQKFPPKVHYGTERYIADNSFDFTPIELWGKMKSNIIDWQSLC